MTEMTPTHRDNTTIALLYPVAETTPGAEEIGYVKADHPNCSELLWQNLTRNPDKLAVLSPSGALTYAELIAEAARWGNAFLAAGLSRGERIAFFLDDTPVSPPGDLIMTGTRPDERERCCHINGAEVSGS